jgi:HrpA-like RNA helicase
MRVAAMIICDIIERLNVFADDTGVEGEEVEKKSILVFLPGYHEIFEFMEYLKQFYDENFLLNKIELIPLHSSLSQEEQDKAFRNTAFMKGRRKVIVATNIAESSITIPDIKYVVDFMLTKDVYYDPVSKSESLQLHHASKASAR